MSSRHDPPVHTWMKWTLALAAAYNLAWGAWVVLWPNAIFQISDMELPRYTMIWQCVGMVVGCYGIGYAIASTNPIKWWPLTLIGLIGKVAGPIGFVQAGMDGTLPWRFGWTIITNDLIWWLPFYFILKASWKWHMDADARDEAFGREADEAEEPTLPPGFPGVPSGPSGSGGPGASGGPGNPVPPSRDHNQG